MRLKFSNQVGRVAKIDELESDIASVGKLLQTKEDKAHSMTKDNMFIDLNGWIIIWDEFHNFLNSLANGSKNAVAFYDLCMNTKNIKIIALSGTHIINDPYELALGFNLLAGPLKH